MGRAEEEKKEEEAEEAEGCVASRFPHIVTVIYSCKIDLVRHLQGVGVGGLERWSVGFSLPCTVLAFFIFYFFYCVGVVFCGGGLFYLPFAYWWEVHSVIKVQVQHGRRKKER